MSDYTPLWVFGIGGWLLVLRSAWRKGRKGTVVLSVFLMIAAAMWAGLLVLGIGAGYREEPLSGLQIAGAIALGAAPLLIALAVPVIAAWRAPLPGSKVALAAMAPPATANDAEPGT